MSNEHTPTPYMSQYATIYEVAGLTKMAELYARKPGDWTAEDHANAAFVVRACNAHAALLEACEAAYRWLESAPIAELEAVEGALDENAPLAELEAAIKQVVGERINHVNL